MAAEPGDAGPTAAPTAWPDDGAALRRLAIILSVSHGFTFTLARVDRPQTTDLALTDLAPLALDQGIRLIGCDLDSPGPGPPIVLERAADAYEAAMAGDWPEGVKPAVMVTGLARWFSYREGGTSVESTGILGQMNVQRDAWPDAVPCPVVLWLPEAAVPTLTRKAPDFADWILHKLTFTGPEPDRIDALQDRLAILEHDQIKRLPAQALRDRITVLEDLITELEAGMPTDRPPSQLALRGLIDTRFDLAQARHDLGDWDGALAVWQQQVLPGCRALADDRQAAVTHGRIADIFEDRGKVAEALRILRDEALPIFERLGDAREIAVTRLKIARTLEARGDLAEARRLIAEQVLPVFQDMGLTRDVGIAEADLARIDAALAAR